MKKYMCFGGTVVSRTDGDIHHIPAHRVAQLYQVPHRECVYVEQDQPTPHGYNGLKHLHPRSDGDYCLPGVNEPIGSKTFNSPAAIQEDKMES